MVARATKDRNERRRRGVVSFFGLETMGFDGPATEIADPGACPACLEKGKASHEGCFVSQEAARAVREGLIRPRKSDGEWVLELTEEGAARAGEIDRARKARRGA